MRLDCHLRTKITANMVPMTNTKKGVIQATRLNPVFVGAASTVGPNWSTKPASTKSSDLPCEIPSATCLRMPSETGQPTWLHSSRIWLQPQVQTSSCPTFSNRERSTSAPSVNIASSAMATTWMVRVLIAHLHCHRFFDGRLLAHRFANKRGRGKIWNQRHQRSSQHHQCPDPDPADEWI